MTRNSRFWTVWLSVALCAFVNVTASGQTTSPPPFLQDIQVQTAPSGPSADLVKSTSSVSPVSTAIHANSSIQALADIDIPGYTGILVQKLDGTTVVELGSNLTFNPASNVKIATAYAVLKTFGPDYRFPTNVWTDGTIDQTTGTLTGNVYVSGRDPIFSYEHAVALANELNHLGIRSVEGDLIVTNDFAMNYSSATSRTSQFLFASLDSSKRSAAATRAWLNFINNSGRANKGYSIPSVTFTGAAYVQPLPSSLKLLFTHQSAPMRDIVKATLCYSNNFLAERLGDMLGGPWAVARVVQINVGVQPSEFNIQTSSGLGPTGQNKAFGTVKLSSKGANRTAISISVSTPLSNAASLNWALLPGRCGAGSLPLVGVERFPVIEVGNNGRGQLEGDMSLELPQSGSYHVNIYWASGTQISDVMTCANLRK